MPKATCQLNLTLEVPVAENVERIAREANYRPSGAGRVLLDERLQLEAAGWKLDDGGMRSLLEAVSRLNESQRQALEDFLRKLLSENSAS